MDSKTTRLVDNYIRAIKIRNRISGLKLTKPEVEDIDRDLCNFEEAYSNLTKLGEGAFGSVLKAFLKNVIVFPVAIKLNREDVEWRNTKEEVKREAEMIQRMSKLVSEKISPHALICICSYGCKNETQYFAKDTAIILTESLEGGTFKDSLESGILHDDFDVYMFQLFLLFDAANKRFGGFSHYDLHPGNMMFRLSTSDGCTHYKYGSENFYLPNIGKQLVLIDYGIARFTKTVPLKELKHLITLFKNDYKDIVPKFYRKKNFTNFLDSWTNILSHPYFQKFRIPRSDVTLEFSL